MKRYRVLKNKKIAAQTVSVSKLGAIAEAICTFERAEHAQNNKKYYHKAHYSIDRHDGIENSAVHAVSRPDDIYEGEWTKKLLYSAFSSLTQIQQRRIYASFFLNRTNTDIAKREGVSEKAVRKSIEGGLKKLKKYFENNFF